MYLLAILEVLDLTITFGLIEKNKTKQQQKHVQYCQLGIQCFVPTLQLLKEKEKDINVSTTVSKATQE